MMSQLILLQSFVEDLLDMGQLKNGVFNLAKEVFDVKETLEMITDTFGPQASAKKINLHFEIVRSLRTPDKMYTFLSEGSPCLDLEILSDRVTSAIPKVIGDARRLKQVLMNLVKNAIKFTKQGSVIIRACYLGEP